jgi:hypothetical protein
MIALDHVVFAITPSRQAVFCTAQKCRVPRLQILVLSNGAVCDMRAGGDSWTETGTLSSCSSS